MFDLAKIGLIEKKRKDALALKKINDTFYSNVYEKSLIYAQDISNNESLFNQIESPIKDLKVEMHSIIKWIEDDTNTTFLNDVKAELYSLWASTDILGEINNTKNKIKKASLEVYQDYLREYKENYYNFDRNSEAIIQDLSRAKKLINKINDDKIEEDEKYKLKDQIGGIVTKCQGYIDKLNKANKANAELLSKGLKRGI